VDGWRVHASVTITAAITAAPSWEVPPGTYRVTVAAEGGTPLAVSAPLRSR
jgi:hypothetical protein